MKKMLAHLLAAGLISSAAATCSFAAETSGNEEMLLFLDIPPVTTASKSEKSIAQAPSVVTVWTDADIKRMGLRTLKELFDRTVGFFTSRQYATPVIGSHGLIADGNEAFLFLIDGHSINSITEHGAADYFLLPALDKIKRVEILRGPGSTLWGSDGAMAVINIITKDGSDINGLRVSVDASSNDGQRTANVLYGKEYGPNKNVMFSYTLSKEEGFPYGTGSTAYRGAYNNPGFTPDKVAPLDEMPDSFEFHTKINLDNMTVSAHMSDVLNTDLWQRNPDPNRQYFGRRKTTYIDVAHKSNISDTLTLETRVFTNYLETDDHMFNLLTSPGLGTVNEEKLAREQSIGLDMLLSKNIKNVHDLKFGVHGVMTSVDPVITYTGLTLTAGNVQLNALPNDYDKEVAAFVEDDWKAAEKLDIILGLRADNDNLLENKTAYMPRFAGIYSIDTHSTVKYCYNTGYVRPPAAVGDLGMEPLKNYDLGEENPAKAGQIIQYRELAANKAEEIATHDLQYLFNGETLNGSVDFYQTTLKNYFNYSGVFATSDGTASGTPAMTSPDGLIYRLATVNANTVVTDGVELDAKKKLSDKIDVYGNVSYLISAKVDSFVWNIGNYSTTLQGGALYTNDREGCAFPCLSYNLGTDIFVKKNVSFNLHFRGWSSMWVLAATGASPTASTYEKLGPENFVDANILFDNLLPNRSMSVSVFAKNLLNNDDAKIGLVNQGGYWVAEGISLGAKISYSFAGL